MHTIFIHRQLVAIPRVYILDHCILNKHYKNFNT